MKPESDDLYFDATGYKCPLLFVKTRQWIKQLTPNGKLEVKLNDIQGTRDIKNYLDKHKFEYTMNTSAGPQVQFCIIGKPLKNKRIVDV